MKLKNTWILNGRIAHHSKSTSHSHTFERGAIPFKTLYAPDGSTARTHLRHEAQHGLWYGAGIGFLIGVYILFSPRWITVSPAWYTHAHWYVILAITTLSCMLVSGCGAAVLGAHVQKRSLRRTSLAQAIHTKR